jgi:hypothetical protein
MKFSIGIVGLPNVGKSTLFKELTKLEVNIANYPFATINPNIGIVSVPDDRLLQLHKMSGSSRIIPAIVEFYDIAGLVRGANKGEGLGNQFLAHIREVNIIVQVIRCFKNDSIIHVDKKINPLRDLETINTELILKDLETIEKRINKLEGEARSGDTKKIKALEIAQKLRDGLNNNILAINFAANFLEESYIKELNLLTAKKQIYLLNGREEDVPDELKLKLQELKSEYLIIDLAQHNNFLIDQLIRKAYEVLGLISFFTTGVDETKAWTITKGTKAQNAAGVIHSDFERKFIRAEVIHWKKLLEAGSWLNAKQRGWLRLEGRDYIVEDGDVMEIKHG